jgi:cell fate (sporulation/competence/biofilm development) regulator YlbF (YheA/YmcA/DUF963 family)
MTQTDDSPVLQKTLELCEVILAQPEFGAMRRQLDDFMANDAAQSAYRNLSEMGAALREKHHQGAPPTPAEVETFEQQRQEFLADPVARGFLEAQQAMQDVRDTITRYVTRTFELGRKPTAEDFNSCGCGSGCGCG